MNSPPVWSPFSAKANLDTLDFKANLDTLAAAYAQPVQGHVQQIRSFWEKNSISDSQDFRFDLNERHLRLIKGGGIKLAGLKALF